MKMTTKMSMTFRRFNLNQMLATGLLLALLAATLHDPRLRDVAEMPLPAPLAETQATVSHVLQELQTLTGGERPPLECAMLLAGLGLGFSFGAIATAATLGTAGPLVMGIALYGGAVLPATALACYGL
ncbi:MAG: hypothetical protein SF339_13510 [Blastocatellia bacterium]|nr:hypothetical protein [Blastocatellia bacterium]